MSEELNLVKDLAVILIAAGCFTLLFKALRQPLILGYIVAGFVVGPHLGLFQLTSTEAVSQWSEIGIIFLLFALGLEFSFKKLLKVGSGAATMAGVKCIGMFLVGILLGKAMGWSMMEGIFLGGLLSMSSTTIIIKAYGDMGLKNKPYAPLIFGSLVVEDLIAVLLMVLLSTLAVSGRFEGGKMLFALGRLVFFIVLWFLVGIYLIPLLLKKVKKLLNEETLLIVSIVLCFLMVGIADAVGFSAALGAFVMGSILAETLEGERIEHLLTHIKNLFGAIFFVSVGMMVDPGVIASQWGPILIITVCAMAGILLFSSLGGLLSGAGLDTSVHAGFTLAQLGEFAFIIAALGVSMGVLREFIYPVIIAVSVITTFTTPYMIKAAEPVSRWLGRVLPDSLQKRLNGSSSDDFKFETEAEQGRWKHYIRKYLLRIGIYGILLLAVVIGASTLQHKGMAIWFPAWSETQRKLLVVGLALSLMLPFVLGLTGTSSAMKADRDTLLQERHANGWKLLSLDMLRHLVGIGFVVALVLGHFAFSWISAAILLAVLAGGFFLLRRLFKQHMLFEDQFFSNLSARDEREQQRAPVTVSFRRNLEKYNVHIEAFALSPDSHFVGKTLRELPYRRKSGVNIIKIQRGSQSIMIPAGDTPVYPYDNLLAVGTEDQLASFRKLMSSHVLAPEYLPPRRFEVAETNFTILPIELDEHSVLTGRTLRELEMRTWGCMAICVLREHKMISNPEPDEPFRVGDLVWLAGEADSLELFLQFRLSPA